MTDEAVLDAAPGDAVSAAPSGPVPLRVRLAVAACTGLALAVGFAYLQRHSAGHEEGYTWSTVDRSFPALLSVLVRHEGYQILHSLLMWPANRVSSTIDSLRSVSVVAFAAAVPAVWMTGRRLFDERTGLLAALLFALNGFALQYAQEARGYMLATMLCAYSGAFLAEYVLAPRRWSRPAWIAFGALTIYAHGFAVLGVAAQIVALWFLPADRRREMHWVRNGFLIALWAAPALLAPLLQINSSELGFIEKPGINELRGLVWSMSGRTFTAIPVICLGMIIALVVAVRVGRRSLHSTDAFRFALPILWAVAPAILLMSLSYLHGLWLERYALWSVVAVLVLAAYGLTRIAPKNALVVVAVFAISAGLAVRGVTMWYSSPPYQDFHSAMAQLAARAQPGDAIAFTPDEARLPAQFYLRDDLNLADLEPVFPAKAWNDFKTGDQRIDPLSQAFVEHALARPYRRLWIVADAEPAVIVTRVNQLRVGYRVVSDRRYTGPVEVVLLVAR